MRKIIFECFCLHFAFLQKTLHLLRRGRKKEADIGMPCSRAPQLFPHLETLGLAPVEHQLIDAGLSAEVATTILNSRALSVLSEMANFFCHGVNNVT